MRIVSTAQGKIFGSLVEDNCLRTERGFTYNPNVFQGRKILGGNNSGLHRNTNGRTESQRGETGMNGTRKWAGIALAFALCLILGSSISLRAQAPAAGQDTSKAPPYTQAEYNAYQACAGEAAAPAKIKCLDDFVSKYPNSALLSFVYPLYTQSYGAQKNYTKVMEYADKLSGLGDKVEPSVRFNGYYTHAAAYDALLRDPQQKQLAADPNIAKGTQAACAS